MQQLAPFPGLASNPFMALTTYRKNGNPVMTPVWFVKQDGKLFIWTAVDSGKVKRMKSDPHVQLGPSTHNGKLLGETEAGLAHFATKDEYASLDKAFRAKYGWQVTLFSLIWKIQRHQHTYIEITPLSAN